MLAPARTLDWAAQHRFYLELENSRMETGFRAAGGICGFCSRALSTRFCFCRAIQSTPQLAGPLASPRPPADEDAAALAPDAVSTAALLFCGERIRPMVRGAVDGAALNHLRDSGQTTRSVRRDTRAAEPATTAPSKLMSLPAPTACRSALPCGGWRRRWPRSQTIRRR